MTAVEYHAVTYAADGATCSCGKVFSIWPARHPRTTVEAWRFINLARANADRHAEAANRKAIAKANRLT